jgi:hypothetical protein
MNPTKLKMQHTIHLEAKDGHLPRPYPALPSFAAYHFYAEILKKIIGHLNHRMSFKIVNGVVWRRIFVKINQMD